MAIVLLTSVLFFETVAFITFFVLVSAGLPPMLLIWTMNRCRITLRTVFSVLIVVCVGFSLAIADANRQLKIHSDRELAGWMMEKFIDDPAQLPTRAELIWPLIRDSCLLLGLPTFTISAICVFCLAMERPIETKWVKEPTE